MGKTKLNYRFHNPNTEHTTGDHLLKIMMNAQKVKLNKNLQEALQQQKIKEDCSV